MMHGNIVETRRSRIHEARIEYYKRRYEYFVRRYAYLVEKARRESKEVN